jgi:putative transposase
MRYAVIAECATTYPVVHLCRALHVSPSGYYAWKRRQPSQRQQHDERLGEAIERIYQGSRQTYGSPRLHAELHMQGIACGRKRVIRLMRQRHLSARRTHHRCRTTDSQHTHPVAPNVLARDFTASHPNEKWVADITGVWTQEGWLYVALILDVYSRLIVGWAMAATRDEGLVHTALRMALLQRQPGTGLLHHSDRGSQYTSTAYRALLESWGIQVSMSRKGDCFDHAMMESFNATLKGECADRQSWSSRAHARHAIFEFIEVWYNRSRRHSALGYVSPVAFEQMRT